MKPIAKTGQPDETQERGPAIRWALSTIAMSMLLSSLGVSIPNVALPTLATVFSASFQAVQWVVIAYLLAITIVIVGIGRLGDVVGHRKVLLAGISVFTVASVLCACAPSLGFLIAARALQGLGAAVLMALTAALVRETVPKERTGSAMGLLGTMSAIGTALGPSLGGLLVSSHGWQSIFLIMVPLGILNFVMAQRHLPTKPSKGTIDRRSLDLPGTALLGVTLAAYALAVTVGGGRLESLNIGLLAAAGLGLVSFIVAESRAASPLIRIEALRNVTLSSSLVMNALVATVMMATLVVGPFYLSLALGLNEAMVGAVMAVGPLISTATGVPAGRIVDRWGAPRVMKLGLVEMAIGAMALAFLPGMLGVIGYVVAIFILTPGYQLFQAANNTAVMIDVQPDQRGLVSGMLSLSRNLGLITGASVMGAVFTFATMTPHITTAAATSVEQGLRITFGVATCLVVIALGIGMLANRRAPPSLEQ